MFSLCVLCTNVCILCCPNNLVLTARTDVSLQPRGREEDTE